MARPERPLHSLVVAMFNEEEVFDEFYERASTVMSGLGDDYEIVFVDDGSRDRTPAKLEAIAAKDPHVRVVFFSRNFGHQVALTAGIDAAAGDTVTAIDADLQDPPEVIPEFVDRWREGADVVHAVRVKREGEGAFKRASAGLFYRLLNRMTNVDMTVDSGDFRLLDRRAADALRSLRESSRYIRGLVSWVGFTQASVEYVRQPRAAGVTKYPLKKMLKFAADATFSFSGVPLQIASWMGFIVAAAGFLTGLYVLWLHLVVHVGVPGWSSIMVAVLFFGGIQLLFLGVVGEYLWRILEQVKQRPLYVVRRRLGFDSAEDPQVS